MVALRVLFLTLEFSSSTFSGNGIYAQSQVRALSELGHQVVVISGEPAGKPAEEKKKQGALDLILVPVTRWGRLDASAPYQEFAAGGCTAEAVATVLSFQPDVVMVVDWSALELHRKLWQVADRPPPPMVYLNYRVFSRTATGEELEVVTRLEREAILDSVLTVVLSRSDMRFLSDHILGQGEHTACGSARDGGATGEDRSCSPDASPSSRREAEVSGRIKVLLCALREDLRKLPLSLPPLISHGPGTAAGPGIELAAAADPPSESGAVAAAAAAFARSRPYLTCCVRLSPEKEPHRFVELVEELARRGALGPAGLVPLMIGSAQDEYAQALKARLRAAAANCVVLESFMGPEDLAKVYGQTRLNVHPATYDAFGMTIVEAASQGAPSLVHDGDGAVGATDLLSASGGEVLLADMCSRVGELADKVRQLVLEPELLLSVAVAAATKARSWSERANGATLVEMMLPHLAVS